MEDLKTKISLEELINGGWKIQDSIVIADMRLLEKGEKRILYDCEVQKIFYTYVFK